MASFGSAGGGKRRVLMAANQKHYVESEHFSKKRSFTPQCAAKKVNLSVTTNNCV